MSRLSLNALAGSSLLSFLIFYPERRNLLEIFFVLEIFIDSSLFSQDLSLKTDPREGIEPTGLLGAEILVPGRLGENI